MFIKASQGTSGHVRAARIFIDLGNKARDTKRYVAAAALYEEALARDLRNGAIHVQCGHMHKESGAFEEAEKHYLAAKMLLPSDADLALQLGHLYKVWDRPQLALDAYADACALQPDWEEPHAEIARLKQVAIASTSEPTQFDCHLDEITPAGWLRGWAVGPEGSSKSAKLTFCVDKEAFTSTACNVKRPDVLLVRGSMDVGFQVPLPARALDGKKHVLGIRDLYGEVVPFFWQGAPVTTCSFFGTYDRPFLCDMDGPTSNFIKGWVLQEDPETRTMRGGCDVLVTCDDAIVSYIKADRYRSDVAMVTGGQDNCGFQFTPPPRYRKSYPQTFRFFLMPDKRELKGSPYTTSFIDDNQEAVIADVVDEINRIHVQLTRLRLKAQHALSSRSFNLADYDAWARLYFPTLRRTVEAARIPDAPQPLVSVIMPTYRPLLSDFASAVESVLTQTYQNWELIIADDGSKQPELTALIERFKLCDSRVRATTISQNSGISNATNAALNVAHGKWIAFFDHDDLLVDVALEVMMLEAAKTGAKMLYSDEDKVDPSGHFVAPQFKPDWNHRLLLNVNYICHLLFVERETLQIVGPLDPQCDGAQDHDLILRLSEHIPSNQIHHVSEILYHWKMTASSTASDISAKPYAIKAGIRAVSKHLERTARPAEVTNILSNTLYNVKWKHVESPSVSIIIPFKDNADITRKCVRRVLSRTSYANFEVILVDNWSIMPETASLMAELSKVPSIRVLRIEEEFNYSRLNNIAAQNCESDFLFFMNNDLFVKDHDWLRVVINEALSDNQVGVVGGKFLYPNGRVQHAGVVLGIGGVAGHVHSGKAKDDGGYAGRALFAQELSAVTGAGMLVRTEAFKKVGGFDEVDLKVAFNDIDLCLKIRSEGYKVIWTPSFTAEHHESISRGSDDVPEKEARFFHENQTMIRRWGSNLLKDPFYNPHFLLDGRPFFDLVSPGSAKNNSGEVCQ